MGIISLSVIFCLDIFDEDSSGKVDYKEFSQDVTGNNCSDSKFSSSS